MRIANRRYSHLLIVFTTIAFIALFNAKSSFGKEIELRLASFSVPGHYTTVIHENWVKEVNEALKGKVHIENYPSGQLFGPSDMHQGVAKGMVDIGQTMTPVMQVMVPMIGITYLPFLYADLDHAISAYQGESLEIIDKYLAKHHLKFIYTKIMDPTELLNNKKPITKVDDIKGMKILVTGKVSSLVSKQLGAVPDSSTPYTEYYMSLKLGVGEGCYAPITSSYLRKTFEVAPYFTSNFSLGFPSMTVVMNLKKWNSLPKDVQQVILEKGKDAQKKVLQKSKEMLAKFVAKAIENGATKSELDKVEKDKLLSVARPIWAKWAKKNGSDAARLLEINQR